MRGIHPRALVHRGCVEAAGFLIDPALVGESEARRRVLALWVPGTQVFRVEPGVIVRLPGPVRSDCVAAPGLPLVRLGPGNGDSIPLSALPLTSDEAAALAPSPDTVIFAREGEIRVVPLAASQRIDVSEWLAEALEAADFDCVDPRSLGTPPPPPEVLIDERTFDARSRMEGVPPASPQLRELLFMLQRARESHAGHGTGRGAGFEVDPRVARVSGAVGSALHGFLRDLGGLFPGFRPRGSIPGGRGDASGGSSNSAGAIPADAELPFTSRLSRVARRAAARMLISLRLSELVGRRQAEYVTRMLDMFERGDLTEALRHAIPLGSLPGIEFLPPLLGLPTPRADLTIQPYGPPARSAIGMGGGLFQDLESIYRRAHERLAAAGRIDEAAFVLVELLQAYAEAVAFLERHGRYQLAAEIAEARELAPGLVVRMWLLAGDRERAICIARRTGAFADAVTRLEQTDPQLARYTRLLWADALASAGDYSGAIEAAWPVEEGRPLVREWMERVFQLGGAPAARMLPRKLELLPETWEEVRSQALSLLAQEDVESAQARRVFAEALRKTERTPAAATLARAAVRALLRDAGSGLERVSQADFRQLVQYAGDGALRADVPQLPQAPWPELRQRSGPLRLLGSAGDVGTLPILDAAFLPGGRCLVALGEAGARLLTRDGRTLVHFDQPAHHLVVADGGDRALILARRGEVCRLARLDLLARRAEYWCEARLSAWAPDYDGSLWLVAGKEGLLAIDATAPAFGALWRMKELPGRVSAIARSPGHCSVVIHVREERDSWGNAAPPTESWERWTFQLPGFTLRRRGAVEEGWTGVAWTAVTPQGRLAAPPPAAPAEGRAVPGGHLLPDAVVVLGGEALSAPIPATAERLPPVVSEEWAMAGVRHPEGSEWFLFDQERKYLRMTVLLEGATRGYCRLQAETLTVADDRGRLLVVDLQQGRLLRELRLS